VAGNIGAKEVQQAEAVVEAAFPAKVGEHNIRPLSPESLSIFISANYKV